MKRLIWLLLLMATPLWGATVVVDQDCPTDGNGSGGYTATCDATAAGNPKNTLQGGEDAMAVGDTLEVRGIHSTHGSCPGNTTGVYSQDVIWIGFSGHQALNCTALSPCTIQPYQYTGVGTGEQVFIQGAISATWTVCTGSIGVCNAPCTNLNAKNIPCDQVWYVSSSGSPFAVKTDGTPTYSVAAASDMSNSNTGHNSKACSNVGSTVNTWMRCDTASDCPSGSSCVGSSSEEKDSFRDTTNNQLMVRWGTGLPDPPGTPTTPLIYSNNNGVGFFVTNSHYVTIRGFNFRNFMTAAVAVVPNTAANDNITISDNRMYYSVNRISAGDDRPVLVDNANDVTITGNNIAYSGSEGIHTQPAFVSGCPGACTCSGSLATRYTITNNWIHNIGDESVLGSDSGDTPWGMILGDCGQTGGLPPGTGNGNYSGSLVSGNIVDRTGIWYRSGRHHVGGISLENNHSNNVFRDNFITNVGTSCILLNSVTNVDTNTFFNNVISKCGQDTAAGGGQGAGFRFESGGTTRDNLVWNNTMADCVPTTGGYACLDQGSGGTCTGNVFRNNIWQQNTATQVIRWVPGGEFDNNVVHSTASGTIAAFGGVNYTCANINTLQTGNLCADPAFNNASTRDFHILTGSPAKNAGTATGMPAAHTTDVNNTITDDHGIVSYADANPIQGGTWDIGADEFTSGGGGGTVVLDVSGADAPDPVAAGANMVYTFTYHNTGSASASNTIIADQLPANVTYVSCTGGSGCVFFPGGGSFGTVAWDIGTLAASGSGSVTLTVSVSSSLGGGSIIRNDSYGITSDETGQIIGSPAVSTTVSSPASRRGRIFPGKR